MRSSLSAFACLAFGLEKAVADCNHNNCLRAVIASNFPTRPTVSDCNSFMAVTVTPSVVTYTATLYSRQMEVATLTETRTETSIVTYQSVVPTTVVQLETDWATTLETVYTGAANGVGRRNAPTTSSSRRIPLYASPCSSLAAYSSACSCIGIRPTTITADVPTTTVTVVNDATDVSYVWAVTHTTWTTHTTILSTSQVTDIQTVTLTSTLTSTATTSSLPAPTLCDNQGLEWAYYPSFSGSNYDDTYSSFVPEDYKTGLVTYSNVTTSIGGISNPNYNGAPTPVYGSPPLGPDYYILNHRGYIFAPQNGTYTFSFSGVDDAVYLWVGPDAYSGWTAANSDTEVAYVVSQSHPGSGTYTKDLVQGEYYPIRIVFAQAQGASVFQLTVTAPDGSDFLSADTDGSPYVIRFSCDLTSAPAYTRNFGSET